MEKTSNELIELFEYALDKFNIAIEIPKEQLKEFAVQFIEKTIAYEILISTLSILTCILVIIAMMAIYKKVFKGDSVKKAFSSFLNAERSEEAELKLGLLVILILIFMISIYFICREVKDIILCFTFPEKIVLEFIGNYI